MNYAQTSDSGEVRDENEGCENEHLINAVNQNLISLANQLGLDPTGHVTHIEAIE